MKKMRLLFIPIVIVILTACQKNSMELPSPKPSGVEVSFDSYAVTGSSLPDNPDVPNYIGGFDSPILENLEPSMDEYYNSPIADTIYEQINDQYSFFQESYERMRVKLDEAIASGNEEEVEEYNESLAKYHFSSEINTVSDGEGYLSFASCITWSEGDGVKHHKVETFNLDVTDKKFLTLSDLFQNANYPAILEDKMADIISKTNSYKEVLYEDSHAPTIPKEEQFFFMDDKLVVYYNPGEVAPEEKGVVSFEIPMEWIQSHLTDRFAKQSTIAVTRPSKLFAFTTRGDEYEDEHTGEDS